MRRPASAGGRPRDGERRRVMLELVPLVEDTVRAGAGRRRRRRVATQVFRTARRVIAIGCMIAPDIRYRPTMTNLFDELAVARNGVRATEGLRRSARQERVTAYIGFDPTASSLHVGSLLTVMGLARLQRFGHTPIAIVGGGTGHDRRSQRQVAGAPAALARADRRERRRHPARSWSAFSTSTRGPTRRASSTTPTGWRRSICSAFLRDTGKYFTVNYMLQKESVSRRLESEEGISFTEFSYLLLQAHDFLELFDRYGCTLQMGGSDQWGNITAGIELIRKLRGEEGARAGLAADDDGVGHEVRQDRSGHDLARSGADVAVPVLPVLAEHRRPRRRDAI